jgi:hypothetical protein
MLRYSRLQGRKPADITASMHILNLVSCLFQELLPFVDLVGGAGPILLLRGVMLREHKGVVIRQALRELKKSGPQPSV